MKNLPTLCNDSSFAVQFSIEEKDNFAVYDKDYRNVWTPRKQSAELSSDNPAEISHKRMFRELTNSLNQSKSLPGFRVVTSLDGINGRLIQTLLRRENDSKQWDEIQAT